MQLSPLAKRLSSGKPGTPAGNETRRIRIKIMHYSLSDGKHGHPSFVKNQGIERSPEEQVSFTGDRVMGGRLFPLFPAVDHDVIAGAQNHFGEKELFIGPGGNNSLFFRNRAGTFVKKEHLTGVPEHDPACFKENPGDEAFHAALGAVQSVLRIGEAFEVPSALLIKKLQRFVHGVQKDNPGVSHDEVVSHIGVSADGGQRYAFHQLALFAEYRHFAFGEIVNEDAPAAVKQAADRNRIVAFSLPEAEEAVPGFENQRLVAGAADRGNQETETEEQFV